MIRASMIYPVKVWHTCFQFSINHIYKTGAIYLDDILYDTRDLKGFGKRDDS